MNDANAAIYQAGSDFHISNGTFDNIQDKLENLGIVPDDIVFYINSEIDTAIAPHHHRKGSNESLATRARNAAYNSALQYSVLVVDEILSVSLFFLAFGHIEYLTL